MRGTCITRAPSWKASLQRALRRSGISALFLWLPVAIHANSGCLLDDNRCGPYQVEQRLDNVALCVCAPNAVPNDDRHTCKPCGDHETVKAEKCECEEGFARTEANGPCEQSSAGTACSDDKGCPETYPYCFVDGESSGYCTTKGCEDNAACPGDWTCESEGSDRVCKSLPSGLGDHCATDSDCADHKASYCERFQTNTCMLQNCAAGDTKCPSEWACCDFSSLVGVSLCMPSAQLVEGQCPGGGKLVTP